VQALRAAHAKPNRFGAARRPLGAEPVGAPIQAVFAAIISLCMPQRLAVLRDKPLISLRNKNNQKSACILS